MCRKQLVDQSLQRMKPAIIKSFIDQEDFIEITFFFNDLCDG